MTKSHALLHCSWWRHNGWELERRFLELSGVGRIVEDGVDEEEKGHPAGLVEQRKGLSNFSRSAAASQ